MPVILDGAMNGVSRLTSVKSRAPFTRDNPLPESFLMDKVNVILLRHSARRSVSEALACPSPQCVKAVSEPVRKLSEF